MGKNRKFISGIIPPEERSEPAWWFAFQESKLLVYEEPSGSAFHALSTLQSWD